jgi:hypothetical protein
MPTETIELTSYQYYQFSSRDDLYKAIAICAGADGKTVNLYFHGGTQALSAASKSGNSYSLYYRYSDMSHIVDMLRNEKPIYLIYLPEGTNNTRISTSSEPIGEGENS